MCVWLFVCLLACLFLCLFRVKGFRALGAVGLRLLGA